LLAQYLDHFLSKTSALDRAKRGVRLRRLSEAYRFGFADKVQVQDLGFVVLSRGMKIQTAIACSGASGANRHAIARDRIAANAPRNHQSEITGRSYRRLIG
jgi:hypothetical protein